VVSFTPWPRFTSGKAPHYPLHRRLGGPRAGLNTEATGKILCLCRGSSLGHPVCSQDTIPTKLSQFLLCYGRSLEFIPVISFKMFPIVSYLLSITTLKSVERSVSCTGSWMEDPKISDVVKKLSRQNTIKVFILWATFWGMFSSWTDTEDTFGRAMAQAVSRRPLTPEVRVRAQVISCRICGGESSAGTSFYPSSSISPVSVNPSWLSTLIYHLEQGFSKSSVGLPPYVI
jgi:hypothetical protein